MEDILSKAKEVASKVIIDAGQLAKERFDNFCKLEEKGAYGDVITEVDHMAEKIILDEISSTFPGHKIHSEEAGDNGLESDWFWQVDPLDGTNNFAIGLPVFSSSITLLYKNKPVLGIIYEPMVERLFITSLNGGSYCNNNRLRVQFRENPRKFNIGWIQGHIVQSEERAVRLRQYIDINCKRMMRLWAPTIQWCMLAKGEIDGIVLYNSGGDDLYSGILMVKEAGGIVCDFQGNEFTKINNQPYYIACHPNNKNYFLRIVNEGLNLPIGITN